MANGYLSIEEVCKTLGMTEDQVKQLVQEGRLREVRDAGKVLYPKGEVEAMGGKGGSSIVELQATDEAADPAPVELGFDESESFASALSSLADSSAMSSALDESPGVDEPPEIEPTADAGDSGSVIAFAADEETGAAQEADPSELSIEDVPEDLPAASKEEAQADAGAPQSGFTSEIDLLPADDSGSAVDIAPSLPSESIEETLEEVPDLGLSGSSIISLEPSDSSLVDSPVAKEDTKFTKVGISVFDDDELDVESDPMGETQISTGVDDFDSVGSGSGLLDLTQESDDTSLGAELLDVISPSDAAETETESQAIEAETMTEDAIAVAPTEEAGPAVTMVPAVAAARVAVGEMPGAVPMNVCIFLGILGLAVLGLATTSVLQGAWPATILGTIAQGTVHYSVFGGLALIAIVTGVISILAGRK